ncbi:MAG: hypothetical protein M3Y59_00720 [Myxococcota bacterium]|nr:hypothetical protein [Myxococcota bacterium]
MKIDKGLGMLLLAVWLILQGLIQLAGLRFEYLHVITGVLAIASGALLLIRR